MQKTPLLEEGTVLRGRKRHKTKYKASKHQQMLQNSNPVRLKHQRSIQNSMAKSSPKVEKNNTEILPKSSKMSPRCGFGVAWSDFGGLTQDIVCQGRPRELPTPIFYGFWSCLGALAAPPGRFRTTFGSRRATRILKNRSCIEQNHEKMLSEEDP